MIGTTLLFKILATSIFAFTGLVSFGQPHLSITENWKTYSNQDGIKVEYKLSQCEYENRTGDYWVVFRYSNTSTETLTMSWSPKWYRAGDCSNCQNLGDEEFAHKLTIEPGEILTGNVCETRDRRFYAFSHFVNIVPGKTTTKLTGFEFTNLTVE